MRTHSTTPFGRRPLSLAMVAAQAATRDFASKPDASETVVHKWRLFRALTEAKGPLGITDRALSVLHALLSFHQETALTLPEAEARGRGGAGDSPAPGIGRFPRTGSSRSAPMVWRRRRCVVTSLRSSRRD